MIEDSVDIAMHATGQRPNGKKKRKSLNVIIKWFMVSQIYILNFLF